MTLATVKEGETKTYSFVGTNSSSTITVKITKINESVGVAEVIVPSNLGTDTYTCSESVTGRFGLCIQTSSDVFLMAMNNSTITIGGSSGYTFSATYTVPVVFY